MKSLEKDAQGEKFSLKINKQTQKTIEDILSPPSFYLSLGLVFHVYSPLIF